MIAATAGMVLPPCLTSISAGRAGHIGVPDIVVDHLEVPQVLSGIRIRRNQAGAEKIVAGAVASILVHRRRAERHIDDAALRRPPSGSPRH